MWAIFTDSTIDISSNINMVNIKYVILISTSTNTSMVLILITTLLKWRPQLQLTNNTIDMILLLTTILPTSAQAHNLLVEVVVPRKLLHFLLVGLNTLGKEGVVIYIWDNLNDARLKYDNLDLGRCEP